MLPNVQTILYATGLGAGAPYVFRYALGLARSCQARIAVVHAMEPLTPFAQSLVEQYITHEQAEQLHERGRQAVSERLQARLEALCRKELEADPQGSSRISEIIIAEGHPAQVVLQQAEALGADLIVIGAHRHTALGEAILGTTTSKVLHSATTPVLVVRIPEGYHEVG